MVSPEFDRASARDGSRACELKIAFGLWQFLIIAVVPFVVWGFFNAAIERRDSIEVMRKARLRYSESGEER